MVDKREREELEALLREGEEIIKNLEAIQRHAERALAALE